MPGAMHCSRWSALPEKMISTRPILRHRSPRNPSRQSQRLPATRPTAVFRQGSFPPAIKLRKGQDARPAKPALAADLSAALRQQLLAEISDLGSSDDAALWAHHAMGRKNALTADDARQVEEGFPCQADQTHGSYRRSSFKWEHKACCGRDAN